MSNNLFSMLSSGLRDADKEVPENDLLAMGFTKAQVAMFKFKDPRLIWYDAKTKTFYDQGDSRKVNKSKYKDITAKTAKKDKPIKNLKYYIPINQQIVDESNKPLD